MDIEIDIAPAIHKVRLKYFISVKPEHVMKPRNNLKSKAFAALTLVAISLSALQAQDTSDRTIMAVALSGDAKYAHGNGSFIPLARGVKLAKGDVIKTGINSRVDLQMGNNAGVVRVAENSTLTIDGATVTKTGADVVTDTQLTLGSGGLYAKVNKLAKGSRYEITSPKGIAGIRGTSLYFGADGRLTVGKGTAGAAYPNNAGGVDTFVVNDGQTVSPTDNPPHPATVEELRRINEELTAAVMHMWDEKRPAAIGLDELDPSAGFPEPFVSPTLPGK